ncbi:MAG: ATP-grasp domain-containing protein [Thermotogota bacterium]|nr:ATP-grasp domain-containing protein [Thermotogota bacterium]HOY26624.1 ATP-grasp domain-containing protein [Mesotoga sp.]
MKIAVVHDEKPGEVGMKMLKSIAGVLEKHHEVFSVPLTPNFVEKIESAGIDFAFNIATGGEGHRRQFYVPAILDFRNIPYTGSGVSANCLCIDKSLTKVVMTDSGIPTPKYVCLKQSHPVEEIDFYPAIVKPSCGGSAVGIWADSVVSDRIELERAVKRIHREYGEPALVEEFIDGREFSIGIVGRTVLPILEIDFSFLPAGMERFYSYRVKQYLGEKTGYICPADIPEDLKTKIESLSLELFDRLDLGDYARIDLRIDGQGEPYFLEVNSLPLLVPDYSDIVKMAVAAGWEYDDLILAILDSAIERRR